MDTAAIQASIDAAGLAGCCTVVVRKKYIQPFWLIRHAAIFSSRYS
jgi:hypothetical protein